MQTEQVNIRMSEVDKKAALLTAKSRGIVGGISGYLRQRMYSDPAFMEAQRQLLAEKKSRKKTRRSTKS